MKLIKHKPSQLASLKIADFNNSFLIRAAKSEITPAEMKITKVEARLNSFPVAQCDERTVIVSFTKVISDVFDFFNTDYNESIISMLVSDIIDEYGIYSPLEIYKAIHEGRRAQGDLYGKLNGRHFLNWINVYFGKMGEEIAAFRSNEKFELQKGLDDLHLPGLAEKFGIKQEPENKIEKRKFTQAEKVSALEIMKPLSGTERARREHSYEWKYEKHGDFETYMNDYDKRNV